MSKNKKKYIILSSLLLVIICIITIVQYSRPDIPTSYKLELPKVILNNDDSEIGEWILPAIMMGEGIDEEFLCKNVYIDNINLFAYEEVSYVNFSIYYVLDQKPIRRSYVIEKGKVKVSTNEIYDLNAVHLLPVTTFVELIKASDKDKIKNVSGITSRITFISMNLIKRLDKVEISDDTLVFYSNQFVPFGDIAQLDNFGVTYIQFVGIGGGVVLPFLFSLKN